MKVYTFWAYWPYNRSPEAKNGKKHATQEPSPPLLLPPCLGGVKEVFFFERPFRPAEEGMGL